MQGAGNDFVVINNIDHQFDPEKLIALTPELCHRKFGIGADGLLALFPPGDERDDYRMFYRNADGSDAGMCGNGARCLALFAHHFGFGKRQTFSVHDKHYEAHIADASTVRITFPIETTAGKIDLDGQTILNIYTGTEHIVTAAEQQALEREDLLRKKGSRLRHHQAFQPKGTNVNFICGIDNSSLNLQTYERGVEDLTLACGTGAVAAALAWHHLQENLPATRPFEVHTGGGTLQVYFSFDEQTQRYSNLELEGPAHVVFEGTYRL